MTSTGGSMDDLPLAAYARRRVVDADDVASEPPVRVVEAAPPAAPSPIAAEAAEAAAALGTADEPTVPATSIEAGLVRARAFARRNPRLTAGAGFVAMIIVGVVLLGGAKSAPSAAGAVATMGTPTTAPVAADQGSASLVVTGSLQATFTLTGSAAQPLAGNTISATWTDPLQNVLTLAGPVDRGTRTTGAGLVLTWGLMVDGKLVTFTSKAGECTIGMAALPKGVSGSFSCRKLKSDDGKLTVGATGTYRT